MHKFGLKLWSVNENYLREATRLYAANVYDFIELYTVPGSFDKYKDVWKGLNIPYVIHAPHFKDGLNLAKKGSFERNRELFAEAQRFSDKLNADKIVVHPGIAGEVEETIAQLKLINDSRILIENKPYYALFDGLICNGTSPEEIDLIISKARIGFCLDVGHAYCAANAMIADRHEYLKRFLALKPRLLHFTDGDNNGVMDKHLHIGKGDYDIALAMNQLPADSMITVETDKDRSDSLDDFVDDINALRKTLSMAGSAQR